MTDRYEIGPPASWQNHAENGFRHTAYCQGCWHRGPTLSPEEWTTLLGVPMTSAVIDAMRRLVCSRCGERKCYFYIENPAIKPHS